MQALTRNPLADPGLLGVNAGASAAVVIALGFARDHRLDRLRLVRLRRRGVASVVVYGSARRAAAARRRSGSRSPAPRSPPR